MKGQKKKMMQKILSVGKVVLLWLMAMGVILIWACRQCNVNFTMFLVDWKNAFVDTPLFPQLIRNKMLLVSAAFALLGAVVLVTEEFSWKIKVFGWNWKLSSGERSFRIAINCAIAAFALVFVVVSASFLKPEIRMMLDNNWDKEALIAHACGGIEETDYTNSMEAFELSYANGHRSIEVDFVLTADDKLVCCHDWKDELSSEHEKGYVCTEEEFLSLKLYDKYTPMSLEMLFELMQKYEDVYVITDTKETKEELVRKEFQFIVDTARAVGAEDVLDRFVVQLYNHEMYDIVEEYYSFPEYILTLYKLDEPDVADFIEHSRFCRTRGFNTITMWPEWAKPEIVEVADRYGIDIYVHTINDVDTLEELKAGGVKGFYTDFITPDLLVE